MRGKCNKRKHSSRKHSSRKQRNTRSVRYVNAYGGQLVQVQRVPCGSTVHYAQLPSTEYALILLYTNVHICDKCLSQLAVVLSRACMAITHNKVDLLNSDYSSRMLLKLVQTQTLFQTNHSTSLNCYCNYSIFTEKL